MQLFSSIAGSYEFVNHVLTLGFDRIWRRTAIRHAISEGGSRWLDICTGTGETAAALADHAGPDTIVMALDMNIDMLNIAAQKITPERPFSLIQGDVTRLPFSDNTFDLVTISFAVRTIATTPEPLTALFREVRRIIAPGGRFIIVDTSQPVFPPLRWCFHLFVRLFVLPVGRALSGSRNEYAYLAHTILRFPGAEDISMLLKEADFQSVWYRRLLFGVAAVHVSHVAR